MKEVGPIEIDSDWSLFLDRDGVINKEEAGTYVLSYDQFEFLPGVLEAMKEFAKMFKYIFIVTNQQCVGKGLLAKGDLEDMHKSMQGDIEKINGRIDAIYYCPDLATENPPNRKPEIGMALQAQKEFPQVDFSRSIMVGNYITDMEFGRNAGMLSVLVEEKERINSENIGLIDYYFKSLFHLSQNVQITAS